jgi:hypothetical protein
MGPISKQWYDKRNLELWSYAAGRIDCRGTDLGRYGAEIGVDPMLGEDWVRFSKWLETFETDFMWNLEDLVGFYERNNPKIRWWKECNGFCGVEECKENQQNCNRLQKASGL